MPVRRTELVRADPEGLLQRTRERHQEGARHTCRRGRLRHRRLRAEPLVPAVGRRMEPVPGQHPRTPHAQLVRDRRDRAAARRLRARGQFRVLGLDEVGQLARDRGDRGVRRDLVLTGVARLQAQVVRLGGQQVARPHVARPQPLAPRHPLRREQRVGARQQYRLVERDVLRAGGPGDRHRPAPAPVGRVLALEVVRDHAVPLGDHGHMLAHHSRRGRFLGRRAGEVYGLGAQTVGNGGTGRTASRRRSTHRSRFSPTPVSRARQHIHRFRPYGCGRSGPGGRVDVHTRLCLPRAHLLRSILRDRREARGQEQPPVARYARYPLRRSPPTCPSQTTSYPTPCPR